MKRLPQNCILFLFIYLMFSVKHKFSRNDTMYISSCLTPTILHNNRCKRLVRLVNLRELRAHWGRGLLSSSPADGSNAEQTVHITHTSSSVACSIKLSKENSDIRSQWQVHLSFKRDNMCI